VNDKLPPSLRRFGVELERAIGRELAPDRRPALHRARERLMTRPRVLAGTTIGAAALATALALVLGATTSAPAFAVTRNHDGTVTVSIRRTSGIAGANARLHQLGIRATVMWQAPAGCQNMHGAPLRSPRISGSRWRISPHQVPAGHTLVLAPPPAPPGNVGGGQSRAPACACPTRPVPPGHLRFYTPAPGAPNGGQPRANWQRARRTPGAPTWTAAPGPSRCLIFLPVHGQPTVTGP
jgi:hypothetical protein